MFNKMGIRAKVLLMFTVVMLITGALVCSFTVIQLKAGAREDAAKTRADEMAQAKSRLQDYVDIAFQAMDATYKESTDPAHLQKVYGPGLVNVIDMAEAAIRRNMDLAKAGEITQEEAKEKAAAEIKAFRYDKGAGYVWINDMGKPIPKMIMHPTVPALDGKVLDDPKYNCALGTKKNLFQAFVDVCQKSGEGYVDYLWPKPTKDGLTQDQPKLSYGRLIPEWGWVLGTGVYVDDAAADAREAIKQDIAKMRYDNGLGYFWIQDAGKPLPTMIMHPTSPALNGKVLDDPKFNCAMGKNQNLFQASVEVTEKEGQGFVDYLWPKAAQDGQAKVQPKLSLVRRHPALGWIVGTGIYIDDIDRIVADKNAAANAKINTLITTIVLVTAGILVLAVAVIGFFLNLSMVKPLKKARDLAAHVAKGDLTHEADVSKGDEIGDLGRAMQAMMTGLKKKEKLAQTIALGDLSGDVALESEKDVLGKALNDMTANLNMVMSDLFGSAQQVDESASQVSSASQSLAQGATEQAASIEEISASLTEIAAQTKTNADNASLANRLAGSAREAGADGGRQMNEMVGAMDAISDSSNQISKIIKAIDDIAFQTNLLALNAAVEAARAGKHGKGFAVVAQEVRSLAARSAKAAQETALLIEGSVERVAAGSEIASKTAQALEGINETISKVADLVGEIAAASNEQAQGITQINQGISQIDSATQQNTANAEETSAASQALSAQATEVRGLLSRFKLKRQGTAPERTRSRQEEISYQPPAKAVQPGDGWGQGGAKGRVVKPEDVIALDDSEFGKF